MSEKDQNINVTVRLPIAGEEVKIELPSDSSAEQLIRFLIEHFDLKRENIDSWYLIAKKAHKGIENEEKIAPFKDDILMLVPNVTAG